MCKKRVDRSCQPKHHEDCPHESDPCIFGHGIDVNGNVIYATPSPAPAPSPSPSASPGASPAIPQPTCVDKKSWCTSKFSRAATAKKCRKQKFNNRCCATCQSQIIE